MIERNRAVSRTHIGNRMDAVPGLTKQKRGFVLFGAMTCLALSLACAGGSAPSRLDHRAPGSPVILVSLDTLRSDHLGCYGYSKSTSPHIDRFSRDSVLFETAVAQASSTKPSHASIFTGLNVARHGMESGLRSCLSPGQLTMAEILKADGYTTISFNGGGMMAAGFGFDQGFDDYRSFAPNRFHYQVERTAWWLDRYPAEKLFLFLHTYEVHHPYSPRLPYLGLFDRGYEGNLPDEMTKEMLDQISRGIVIIDDADREHIRDLYNAELRSADAAFGELIMDLTRRGLYDTCLIIVTSDHGEEFGEHGAVGWHSHTLYDELIRVPLMIRFPGGRFSGSRIGHQVRSIDILPTLLDVLNISPPATTDETPFSLLDGTSLVGMIRSGKGDPLPSLSQRGDVYSMRFKSWKLYQGRLFDLRKDPLESLDLAASDATMRATLEHELHRQLEGREPTAPVNAEPDPETMEQLKILGYVE